jgi:hypothetical protein
VSARGGGLGQSSSEGRRHLGDVGGDVGGLASSEEGLGHARVGSVGRAAIPWEGNVTGRLIDSFLSWRCKCAGGGRDRARVLGWVCARENREKKREGVGFRF